MIENLIHNAILRACRRCGHPTRKSQQIGPYQLCPACVIDFYWWLEHPPEDPDANVFEKEETDAQTPQPSAQ